MTKIKCTKCKAEKDTNDFTKTKTKRGYCYRCRDCRNNDAKIAKSTKSAISAKTTRIRPSNDNKDVTMIIMDCALRHTVSFDSFIEVIKEFMNYAPFDIVCDIAFKQCRATYPNHYTQLIRELLQAPQEQDDEQEQDEENEQDEDEEHEHEQEQEPQYDIPTVSNLTQLGEDIESDDEHFVMTCRGVSGTNTADKFVKMRVKRTA